MVRQNITLKVFVDVHTRERAASGKTGERLRARDFWLRIKAERHQGSAARSRSHQRRRVARRRRAKAAGNRAAPVALFALRQIAPRSTKSPSVKIGSWQTGTWQREGTVPAAGNANLCAFLDCAENCGDFSLVLSVAVPCAVLCTNHSFPPTNSGDRAPNERPSGAADLVQGAHSHPTP
jgi:hypothetical protein